VLVKAATEPYREADERILHAHASRPVLILTLQVLFFFCLFEDVFDKISDNQLFK
jgi:hypothetical protein